MFAVVENSTGVSLHLLDAEPVITADRMEAPFVALDIKAATHSAIEIEAPADRFLPGVMTVTDGAWAIPDQAAYDAMLAALTPREPVPEEISDRQFFQALWEEGHISYEEAVAAVETGTIPATMEGFIALLESYDETGAKKARLLLKGATEFKRSNYIVPVFGSMYGMSDAEIDDLWRLAATL